MKQTLTLTLFFFHIIFFGFFLVYMACVPFYLVGLLWEPSRRLGSTLFRWVVRYTIIGPFFNHEINIELPPCGVMTVSNHRSTLDTYLLLAWCPGIRIISKQTLFRIPFLGFMMRLMGHIPLKSGDPVAYRKAFEKAEKIIKAGGHVHVFPEMTRCPKGFKFTQKFHLLPFKVAKDSGQLLIPLVIKHTDLVWPKGVWQMDNKVKLQIETLAALKPDDYATAKDLCEITQRKIDEALGLKNDH